MNNKKSEISVSQIRSEIPLKEIDGIKFIDLTKESVQINELIDLCHEVDGTGTKTKTSVSTTPVVVVVSSPSVTTDFGTQRHSTQRSTPKCGQKSIQQLVFGTNEHDIQLQTEDGPVPTKNEIGMDDGTGKDNKCLNLKVLHVFVIRFIMYVWMCHVCVVVRYICVIRELYVYYL